MITVIVTSRASALKRELVDRHFSPCWTLPTLPTTSTETWLIFLKVFFSGVSKYVDFSVTGVMKWNILPAPNCVTAAKLLLSYRRRKGKPHHCQSSAFQRSFTQVKPGFFLNSKKLTSLCFAKDSKQIDCFQDFWSSQNPGQLNPRLWNSDWTFCRHKRDAPFELCS